MENAKILRKLCYLPLFYLSLKDSSSKESSHPVTKSAYLLQQKIKCFSIKGGIWRACFIQKQGHPRVKHGRNRKQDCGLRGRGNRLLGLGPRERLQPPAFSYYGHQGSSRIEAKQALQFSNLELTNSQRRSLKKIRHDEIQVSQMILLMGEKKRPMLHIRRRKRANFGQSPSGH